MALFSGDDYSSGMNFQMLLQSYGYWALLVGTALEGEIILLLGGFAAHSGYLRLSVVILCAFIGTLIGDQFFFLMGRKKGKGFIERRPRLCEKTEKARELLHRHRFPVLLGFRFIYGFRSITPFLVGTTRISYLRFFVLNAIGAIVWASTIAALGYFFGQALTLFLGDIHRYELAIAAAILIVGFFVWLFLCVRAKRCAVIKEEIS